MMKSKMFEKKCIQEICLAGINFLLKGPSISSLNASKPYQGFFRYILNRGEGLENALSHV